MSIVNPGQPRGVRQHEARLSAEYGYDPRIPGPDCAVRYVRTIWGKYRTHLELIVAGELQGFAIRQELDVDLPGTKRRVHAADKGQHPPVGRKRRRGNRIGEIREPHPLGMPRVTGSLPP